MARDYSRGEILGIIEREAQERGIPRDDFLRFAYIETGGSFDESVSRGPNGAKGLFQFVPSTAAQYGISGRELDPVVNTDAAARLYLDNRRALVARHERDDLPYLSGSAQPDGLDMYMAHQQGIGGYRSIQAAISTGSFSRDDTRSNILNNVSARDFQRVTGVAHADFTRMGDRDMAQAFTQYWDAKFDRVRIPEVGIEPVTTGAQVRPAGERTPASVPTQTAPAGEGRWPAPGNTAINQADRPGEGRGEFGTSRAGGSRRHGGVDIQGDVGDPIVAYAGGTVRVQPNNGAAGNTVTIDHGNGVVTRYFHLDAIGVQNGQRVDAGDQIGTMGRSGNTPRQGDTHLHFEMLRNGQRVDPMQHLQVPGREQGTSGQTRTETAAGLLREGSRGADVQALQGNLNRLGYTGRDGQPLETRTGVFGAQTEHAVRTFQQAHGLEPVDGKAGRNTLRAMEGALANPLVTEANHSANGIYRAVEGRLREAAADASPEVRAAAARPTTIAAITLESMQEAGIRSAADVRAVAINAEGRVGVQGPTTGVRADYTLSNSTATLTQLSEDLSREAQQRTVVQTGPTVAQTTDPNQVSPPTIGAR